MHPLAHHYALARWHSADAYLTLGPWPANSILQHLTVLHHATGKPIIFIWLVLHPSRTATATTIITGHSIINAGVPQHTLCPHLTIRTTELTTASFNIPLSLRILTPDQYVHVHLRDDDFPYAYKDLSLHISGMTPKAMPTAPTPKPIYILKPSPTPPLQIPPAGPEFYPRPPDIA